MLLDFPVAMKVARHHYTIVSLSVVVVLAAKVPHFWTRDSNIHAIDLNSHPLSGVLQGNFPIFTQALAKEIVRHVVDVAALAKPFRYRSSKVTSPLLDHGILAFVD